MFTLTDAAMTARFRTVGISLLDSYKGLPRTKSGITYNSYVCYAQD